jgi:anaerobic selenocysteine-containing dehydrogenase
VGLLAGWRGEDGDQHGKGAPNPQQLQRYIENNGFWREEIPEHARYFKMANRGYLEWAQKLGFVGSTAPIVLQLYSEPLQKFRLAAQGHGAHQPPPEHRERVATYFDPLPIWYEPFESAQTGASHRPDRDEGDRSGSRMAPTPPLPPGEGWGEGTHDPIAANLRRSGTNAPSSGASRPGPAQRAGRSAAHEPMAREQRAFTPEGEGSSPFPLHAVTQRPMFMYHSWGSQNAWLRQITARNYLYLHPATGAKHGIADEDWISVTSHHGSITVQAKFAGNVQPDTVWTWNAIGKRRRAWRLAKDAPEGEKGFLMNHLISDITPRGDYANADPVTGQAAWFDLRVRIDKAAADDAGQARPQFAPLGFAEADEAPLRYGATLRARAYRR